MSIFEYNEEEEMKKIRADEFSVGRETGKAEGNAEGKAEGKAEFVIYNVPIDVDTLRRRVH